MAKNSTGASLISRIVGSKHETRLAVMLLFILAISFQTQTIQTISALTTNGRMNNVEVIAAKSAQNFMSDRRAVGLSIGIVKDGKTYTYNYGEVERGKKERPTQHTIYEIASITKTFTGILLAQAVIEKKVKMDDDAL